jgi:hypothetical protein
MRALERRDRELHRRDPSGEGETIKEGKKLDTVLRTYDLEPEGQDHADDTFRDAAAH